jgi:hypothetical protein
LRRTPTPRTQTRRAQVWHAAADPARARRQPRWSVALTIAATPALLAAAAVIMLSGLSPADASATVHTSAVAHTVALPGAPVATPQTTVPTTTVPAPPPTTTVPPPPPTTTVPPPAPASSVVPPQGQATAYGCGPALAYLAAYSAPGFQLVCPGDSQGHQATTCISSYPCAPGQKMIIITDPCPAAYMNEAHNSWAVQYGGAIDPYGYCRN